MKGRVEVAASGVVDGEGGAEEEDLVSVCDRVMCESCGLCAGDGGDGDGDGEEGGGRRGGFGGGGRGGRRSFGESQRIFQKMFEIL